MSEAGTRLADVRKRVLVLLAAVASLALVAPIVPVVRLLPASAQELLVTGEAVWRALRQSSAESWGGGQSFAGVDFVRDDDSPAGFTGFALLDRQGAASVLRSRVRDPRPDDPLDGETRVWDVVHDELVFTAFDFLDVSTGLAVNGRNLYRTDNGGPIWKQQFIAPELLNDVAFADDDFAVTVGRKGTIVRSDDGGLSWKPVLHGLTTQDLNAVAFVPGAVSPGDAEGAAVGDDGTLLYTVDGGENWSLAEVPESLSDGTGDWEPGEFGTEVDLLSVAFSRTESGTLGVAVGDNATLVRSDDGGRTWKDDPTYPQKAQSQLLAGAQARDTRVTFRDVTFASTGTGPEDGLVGYIVGDAKLANAPNEVVVLEMQGDTGDGEQWARAPVDVRGAVDGTQLNAVAVVDVNAGTALAVGAGGLMLERTPTDDAAAMSRDRWWRCVPGEDGEGGEGEGVDLACDSRDTNLDDANFGGSNDAPTPAVPCDVHDTDEFPCQATWQARDEEGRNLEFTNHAALFFDDDVAGEGRRVVAWQPQVSTGNDRILLFDPDAFTGEVDAERRPIRGVQRGVSGFGEGSEGGVQNQDNDPTDNDLTESAGNSALGAQTGVVNLADAPAVDAGGAPLDELPPRISTTSPVAYDDEGDRLYLATLTGGSVQDRGNGPERYSPPGEPPRIVAVSLTSDFPVTVTEVPAVDSDAPGRRNEVLTRLGFDVRHGMLYAVTEANPRINHVEGFPGFADSSHVTLHAFEADAGSLRRAWSLGLEDSCRTTAGLSYLGVSSSGSAVSFACQGISGPYFGMPTVTPNTIVTMQLRLRGRDPGDLNPLNPADISVLTQAIAGKVAFEQNVTLGVGERNVLAWNQTAQGAGLWDYVVGGWVGIVPFKNIAGMAGFGSGTDTAHPWRGRLYVTCGGGGSGCEFFDIDGDGERDEEAPALVVVDTLNVTAGVPANITGAVPLLTGWSEDEDKAVSSAPTWGGGHVLATVPPRAPQERPRLLFRSSVGIHLFEDGVPPPLPQSRPNPDDATNQDVPEAEASDVKRIGRASGYGTRVWWSGLGTASALACEQLVGGSSGLAENCGEPTLSYEWLTDPSSQIGPGQAGLVLGSQQNFGRHTSNVPGLPGGGNRELRLGSVQRADVEQDSLSGRFDGKATAFFYDGGPADPKRGSTGEDLKRRRGRDPHLFVDEEMAMGVTERLFCSPSQFGEQYQDSCRDFHDEFRRQHEGTPDDPETEQNENEADPGFDGQFEPFEAQFDEFVDRAMREVDGERRIEGGCDDPETQDEAEDCFEDFDENDLRCEEDDDGNVDCSERSSLEEHTGLTYASTCLEPHTQSASFAGSEAVCDVDGERTEASAALGPFSLSLDERFSAAEAGISQFLSVGASGSHARTFLDEELGMVVETTAFASEVELAVPGGGSVSIGEVRTTARAWAKGREGTADSWVRVGYEDVVITNGEDETVFACGRADPDAGPPTLDPTDPPQDEKEFEEQFGDSNGDGNDRDGDGESDGPDEKDAIHTAGLTPDERFAGDGANASPGACDPYRVVDVISTVFAGKVQATTAAPDTDEQTAGSEGGAQAIVRRDPRAVMSDFVINRIDGLWELPGLQLTVFNDGLRVNRVQIDLAAVYAETHYEIGERRTELPVSPGAIDVTLSDPAGSPLAGGGFGLLADRDGDGQFGAADAAVAECMTDGDGSCSFDGLESGSYLVEQRGAPAGYLADDAPRAVFVSEGGSQSVEFVNLPDSAAIEVLLVDPSGTPLEGGQFALVPDPDGSGAVEPSDAVAAACVTGGDGTCRFDRVGLSGWVLHQAVAPGGYQAAADVAFALRQPGQVAQIRVVNGPAVAGASVRIIEIIDHARPVSHIAGDGAGSWWALLPRGLAALLQRGWVQALLFALTGMLLGAPAYLAHRRRELALAKRRR